MACKRDVLYLVLVTLISSGVGLARSRFLTALSSRCWLICKIWNVSTCVCFITSSMLKFGGFQQLILDNFITKVLDDMWDQRHIILYLVTRSRFWTALSSRCWPICRVRLCILCSLCYSQHPKMWRLSGADSGSFHPKGAGPDVAREVP
jgi:hypothetical protein